MFLFECRNETSIRALIDNNTIMFKMLKQKSFMSMLECFEEEQILASLAECRESSTRALCGAELKYIYKSKSVG